MISYSENAQANDVKDITFDKDIVRHWDILDETIKRFYEVAYLAEINIIIADRPANCEHEFSQNFLPECINGRTIVNDTQAPQNSRKAVKYYHKRPNFDTLVSLLKRSGESVDTVKNWLAEANKHLKTVPHEPNAILAVIEKDDVSVQLMKKAFNVYKLSYQEFVTTLKLTNAIRALEGTDTFKGNHVAEAIQYICDSKDN